jgi:hypothetical protein
MGGGERAQEPLYPACRQGAGGGRACTGCACKGWAAVIKQGTGLGRATTQCLVFLESQVGAGKVVTGLNASADSFYSSQVGGWG